MVLREQQIADRHKVPNRLLVGTWGNGRDEIVDDRRMAPLRLLGASSSSPSCAQRETYDEAVDLRDRFSFDSRMARKTVPSFLISFLTAHSSAWEIEKWTAMTTR